MNVMVQLNNLIQLIRHKELRNRISLKTLIRKNEKLKNIHH